MATLDEIRKLFPMPDRWAMRDTLFDFESGGQVHTRSKTLIQSALRDNGYKDQADRMAACKPSSRCYSPYCDACQRGLFSKQRTRFKDNLLLPYKSDDAAARKNLYFVTVLHSLIPFEQPEEGIIRFPTEEITSALDAARTQLKSVRRSFNYEIKFVGAFELEALNGLLVQLHPVKGQVLAEMNGTDIHENAGAIIHH